MTHISKKSIPEKELEKLFNDFSRIISSLSKKSSSNFFDDFYTDAEKIMLTKRLTTILLLSQGMSSYKIAEVLCMSPSTTDKIRLQYEIGNYKNIVDSIYQKTHTKDDIWQLLEKISRGGLPEMGAGRWKNLKL